MGQMKTPGVYIVEKSAFPNSVVEVATAVPAFIGYTEKASNKGKSLRNVPWRISSMSEFHNYFGFGPTPFLSASTMWIDSVPRPGPGSTDRMPRARSARRIWSWKLPRGEDSAFIPAPDGPHAIFALRLA